MANAANTTGAYSGRSAYFLELYVVRVETDVANNRSRYRWELYAQNPSGSSSTFALDCFPWGVNVGGVFWGGCYGLDFRGGQRSILLAGVYTEWFAHDAVGDLTLVIDANHGPASVFGTADPPQVNFVTDRIPKPPTATINGVVDSATSASLRYRFGDGGDGGSPILEWQIEWSTDAAFPIGSWRSAYSSGVSTVTGLVPGTTYYFRSRGRNAYGFGPYGAFAGGATLPSVPPGMLVTPSASGVSASVALTPPSGGVSVTSYRVERRLPGGAATTYNTATSPLSVASLAPGELYEWRASALIGTYQTPWADWTPVIQPNPNVNPGDYFDGSTTSTVDVTYAWTGMANNSTSVAQGRAALGWRTFAQSLGSSGLAASQGIQERVVGGRSGAYASRITFLADATAAGYSGGTSQDTLGRQAVAEGGVYWGSVYVLPSRPQRMTARIEWLNASGIGFASSIGDAVVVPAGPSMTRLAVQGTAPTGAVWAAVAWRDIDGAGHSPWRGGDTVLQDDAMLNVGELYDWFSGATPNTAQFNYQWLGAANASESSRTSVAPGDFDPLADPDCPPIASAPRPPVIADDCLDEEGTWRRYWAVIARDQVSDWLDIVPTIGLTAGAVAARQVRIRTYQNPLDLDPSEFPADTWDAEQIVSYIPPNTTLTIDGVAQRVWAEAGGAAPISADRLLYGTGGGPATWPVLSCGVAYLMSFDAPLDAPEGNLMVGVALTTRML